MNKLIFTIVLILLPVTAMAHAMPGSGVIADLYNPIGGWDHFLVLVAVGMISSQLGKRAIGLMVALLASAVLSGWLIGMWQNAVPIVEWGVVLSILFMGLQLVMPKKIPVLFTYLSILVCGFWHGYDNASEVEQATTQAIATVGFIVTTAALYMMGMLLGLIAYRDPVRYK